VSDDTHKLGPEAPTVGFVKHAGDTSGKTADHAAWMKDLEERTARAAAFEAKRREHLKPHEPRIELSVIDDVLNTLDAAAEDFEQSYGKVNEPLIQKRQEVADLEQKLSVARQEITLIESRGDSVQRLTGAVARAETQLQSLVDKAESEEIGRLAEKHYGWAIPYSRISTEMKRDFKNHASFLVLKKFYVPRTVVHPGQPPSVDALKAQLQIVGEKLVALREHLEPETA
jgi:DNA repair exonuclease SbcCD ATPase subunit